jgi:hypothetical protein
MDGYSVVCVCVLRSCSKVAIKFNCHPFRVNPLHACTCSEQLESSDAATLPYPRQRKSCLPGAIPLHIALELIYSRLSSTQNTVNELYI